MILCVSEAHMSIFFVRTKKLAEIFYKTKIRNLFPILGSMSAPI